MRVKQATLALAAVGVLALLTACDSFAEYTLINDTGQELITWPLLHHCDKLVGHDGDYLDEDVVMPHSTLDYFYVSWFPEPGCVQVATKDRRIVLSEPYEYGGTYTVREPLQPLTDPIPEEEDLPTKPFAEAFMEAPLFFTFGLAVWASICIGFVSGTVVGITFLYLRFRAKATAIRGGTLAAAGLASTAVWLGVLWWWLSLFWVDMPLRP